MDDNITRIVAFASARQSLLDGADWGAILWALAWATIVSVAKVMRDRRASAHTGEDPRRLQDVWPEIVLGSVVGSLAPFALELFRPQWATLSGVTIAAAVGGFIGVRALDWAQLFALSRAEQLTGRRGPNPPNPPPTSGGTDAP
ncbi:hypothetical protein [Deinococcus pimensis]|uniref:hypothetical protein n=1 Tax=Deinococcus pimensis TaxID=309888 RepID=UPI000481C2D1|nr:hypothetical protein [Deinococcus pimensis]